MKTLHHFTSLKNALCVLFGEEIKIETAGRISGGDINEAYRLTLTDGKCIFMKTNKKENSSFFTAETAGLVSGGKYGFYCDNYIGRHSQVNTGYESWTGFFRDCRLEPQFRDAARYFDKEELKRITRLLDRIDEILVEPEYPSLLHGDLWGGNVIAGNDGAAWLIDPAVYVGHAEADLAMTELFGGFPPVFYDAYKEAAPLQPGYERRRDVYNLYHLLNHLNLFGRMYLPEVRHIISRAL